MPNVNPHDLMALWEPLCGFIRARMNGYVDAEIEDIAGSTIERIFRLDPAMDARPNGLRNYAYTVAARLIIDHGRRRRRMAFVPLTDINLGRGTSDAGSERHLVVIDVQDAVTALPEPDQAMIRASYFEGLTWREIGIRKGYTTHKTTWKPITRGKAALRRALEGGYA